MPKSRKNSKAISAYLLIIGGILTILPNIPVINEILPIMRYDFSVFSQNFTGSVNFLGTYGNLPLNIHLNITGWTMLGLQGSLLFIIFVAMGIIAVIVGLLLKSNQLVKLTGIIEGIIGLIILALIYLGDSQKSNTFGLSNFFSTNSEFIGAGFLVLLIGCILLLISGVVALKE